MTATDDNRFAVTWEEQRYNGSQWLTNIYYTARNGDGSQLKPSTALTNATYGSNDGYYYPFLTRLAGSRVLLTFERGNNYGDIYFEVLDSAGNVVKGLTNLSGDGNSVWDWRTPAAAQLSNGNILVAWTVSSSKDYLRYAVLNAAYAPISGPTALNNQFALTGESYVSVIPDQNGRAALTWTDDDYQSRNSLYYALVDQAGSVLTPPMIFHRTAAAGELEVTCTARVRRPTAAVCRPSMARWWRPARLPAASLAATRACRCA